MTYSWLLLYKEYDDQLKAAALKQYVKWCLTEGQAFNETLGYVRSAPQVIARTMAALDSISVAWWAPAWTMDQYRLDLKAIEQSLRDVQREFPKINEILQSRRLHDRCSTRKHAGWLRLRR